MPKALTRRRAAWVLGGVAVLAGLTVAAWMAVAGPVTVMRVVRHGDTDIGDFRHYPGRQLVPSPSPSPFERAEVEPPIPYGALTEFGEEGELERILASNDSIAFLVIRNDVILYQRYFQGHGPSSLSQAFSMAKSFTSALVGTAIADGLIAGEDQAITQLVPELADQGFAGVEIRHLLTMTSGSSYVENDNPCGEHVILNYTPRLEGRILEIATERPPGEAFRYKSGDNALLGLALDRALGAETITAYTQRRLWTPLGMEDPGVWSIDHEGDGLEKTWCCLAASARDFAKLGRLYLHEGYWNGEQVLPSDWVARSTRVQIPRTTWPDAYEEAGWSGYGYQWWLASETEGDFFALGKDGQFLYVNRQENVIIVRLGWSTGGLTSGQWIGLFQALAREMG